MPIAEKTYPGAYRAGESYLHRLDPRCKLLLVGALMVCLFSAPDGWRVGLLFSLWGVAAYYCENGWRDGLRVFRLLRWLLLFTLALHLFFTPGRTLFGTSWLYFDGLLRGLLIDCQLLLAVLFSMLLAWTTPPDRLAWGLTSLLSPLEKLKLPVREAGGMLILVMQFLPIIRDEVMDLRADEEVPAKGLAGIKAKAAMVLPLLMQLVSRADQMAVEIATGKEEHQQVLVDRRLTQFDWVCLLAGSLLLPFISMV